MLALIPLWPLVIGLGILALSRLRENVIHHLAMVGMAGFGVLVGWAIAGWGVGHPPGDWQSTLLSWNVDSANGYRFVLALHLDRTAATFLLVTAALSGMVARFSHYYMHREPGQARYFATLMLLASGMAMLELAANIETLFVGWELVGMGSFLLVGYYREREHPIRNALLVYSVYRICDMGILLSAYLQHHHYGSSNFEELSRCAAPDSWLFPIALLILLSAAGKSGQFPFSFWVPRAMEGPTPSSAIFYGALSIHAGVFLLLRTSPVWFDSPAARLCIGLVGGVSALLATWIGHVQCNIKGQIGYASVAQVGLMFVELALGLESLVLVHFVGNASLRCYQLLVSPSAVAHLLRLQSSTFGQQQGRFSDWSWERVLPNRLRSSLYVLASQEASMPRILERYFFAIPQWTARHLLGENGTLAGVWTRSLVLILGLTLGAGLGPRGEGIWYPFVIALLTSYLLGIAAAASLPRRLRNLPLSQFYGLARSFPWQARLTFLSFLGMSGFPISPVFFGEDLLLSSVIHVHPGLVVVFALVFMLNGVVLARSFSRLYLGRPATGVFGSKC